MRDINLYFSKEKPLLDYGFISFLIGVFFLPSTMLIGILFLLPAFIIASLSLKKSFFKDYWNFPFLIFGFLIIISAIFQNYLFTNNYEEIWDTKLSLVGLFNWIPLIWVFWASQPYLNSKSKRRSFSLILVAGTFPVLITGFGQYFLNWNGPFETLNGLVIWYQRPISKPGGLTGLFSNQNYAASWLSFVWPFCIALLLEKGNNLFKKTTALGFLISTGLAAFLTFSRNAWLGLITSTPIVIGKKGFKFFLPLLTITIIILFFLFSPIFEGELQNNLRNLLPTSILLEFSNEGYKGLDITRMGIYKSAIELIKENPFFGIGAGSFTEIFLLNTTFWKGHSHNLLLELSLSYGLPATFLFFVTTTYILYLSSKKIFSSNITSDYTFIDRAFWSALFFFLISQLSDIQYFDGKISLITWILIAGLKNIICDINYKTSA
ncbi:MAG: O-antigen ligase family protein [Prochlorococcus marinus CUG1437]|nr:O-antigen ligase family protein [Prochlorococcus marinus CUG1437]